jgi:proline dehydrogenase
MLRQIILFLSRASWARAFVMHFPLARRAAARFVPGPTSDDAIAAVKALNARGMTATIDHLGESVTDEAGTREATEEYLSLLDKVAAAGVRANVSVKLTAIGLDLDKALCIANMRRILDRAKATGNFARIDMEDSNHTEATIAVFQTLAQEYGCVGIVLQSYLFRTEQDLLSLTAAGARVRLCKGAYNEPPDRAFPRKQDVDASFARLACFLLDRTKSISPASEDGRTPSMAALATHDERLIIAARTAAAERGVGLNYYEFQMLYGIRPQMQDQLASQGFAVRVYVPFGTYWYPYYMRRLAERPANVWFIVSNVLKG